MGCKPKKRFLNRFRFSERCSLHAERKKYEKSKAWSIRCEYIAPLSPLSTHSLRFVSIFLGATVSYYWRVSPFCRGKKFLSIAYLLASLNFPCRDIFIPPPPLFTTFFPFVCLNNSPPLLHLTIEMYSGEEEQSKGKLDGKRQLSGDGDFSEFEFNSLNQTYLTYSGRILWESAAKWKGYSFCNMLMISTVSWIPHP